MPKKLKILLTKYKNAKFTVHKTGILYYSETYLANGKDIFQLTWYDRLYKPSITYLEN